ncbi:MAG: VanZ family protein [Steroidobacteraceae bacterium]
MFESLLASQPPARRMKLLAALAAIAGLLLLVVFAELPHGIAFLHVLQKTAHPFTFGAVCWLILWILRGSRRRRDLRARDYLAACALAVALGGLTEIAQIIVHRDPALTDVLRDALGCATALALHAALAAPSMRREVASVAAGLGLAAILAPLAWTMAAYVNRAVHFPALAMFESPLDLFFLTNNDHDPETVIVPKPWSKAAGETALDVPLGAGPWPGITIDESYPDWTGRSTLALDITNPTAVPAVLTVRIQDRWHNQEFNDRFNREFTVPAATRAVVRFAVADIAAAPAGRPIDLAHMTRIGIFVSRKPAPSEFLLHRIWLE